MKNVIYNGNKYFNVFQKDDNTIFKFSPMSINGWKLLNEKKLEFLNTPLAYRRLKEEEKQKFRYCNSLIKLEFLKDYVTLNNFSNISSMNKIEVLNLIKKLLELIKQMHLKNVVHSDLNPDNIMINNNLDLQIIDLDSAIVDDFISNDNIYVKDNISLKDKINNSINDDKLDIFRLLIYYLINNTFKVDDIRSLSNSNFLILPKELKMEIDAYLDLRKKFQNGYYFEDIIDELANMDIEKNTKIKRF